MSNALTVKDYVSIRNDMLYKQHDLYVSAIKNINAQNRELLKNDFGITLVKNCAWDAADAIVSKYFNTADYYISVQQMVDRIIHFSYENDIDPLRGNNAIRKALYENENAKDTLIDISKQCHDVQEKLFTKEEYIDGNGDLKKRYIDHKLIDDSKDKYRKAFIKKHGESIDELTGIKASDGARIEVDHIQPLATASYNAKYIKSEGIDKLKEFYNSDANFQNLNKSANASKGDVKVYRQGDKIVSEKEYIRGLNAAISQQTQDFLDKDTSLTKEHAKKLAKAKVTQEYNKKFEDNIYEDYTYKATSKQRADAIRDQLEESGAKENLKKNKTLNDDGKVPQDVYDRMEDNLRESMNAESGVILKNLNHTEILKDAYGHTKKSLTKILVGQVVYYVLPPMVFETQTLIKKKGITLDQFFTEIKKSGKRIVNYVTSKLGEILKNIAGNAVSKLIKSFFDIIIEIVKETAKRLVKMAKQLVLSLVNCVKIIANKNSSPAEKADAVTKTLAVTITSVLLEVLFEWAEIELGLPDILMEPLQFIATILLTNLVMLILQKADLFDVQYGLLVANIERVFETEYQNYIEETTELIQASQENISHIINDITSQIHEIENSIETLNLYEDDVMASLNVINSIFDMGIDFDKEWQDFISVKNGG